MNSTKTFLILASVFLFAVFIGTINKAQVEKQTDIWVPTEEDILYQDSMWNIIENTRLSVDTIRSVMDNIIWKLEKLEQRGRNVFDEHFDMECGDTIEVSAIRYGDTVCVQAGHKTGVYIVRDAMNKRFKHKIDFLESVGTDLYSFDEAMLIINS